MNPYTIIGIKRTKFDTPDGKTIHGYNLYVAYDQDGVDGKACERLFVSESKLENYVPRLGDNIVVNYNRYGKVQAVYQYEG